MGASQEADRRAVTVLFADLSGFTSLAEELDPEDVRALQGELFDAMRGVLEPLGAFIEKFIGDAVVAVFGAPHAHEDDPERAMHAALGMHRAAAGLSARWQRRLGSRLELHIGVNTGRVVAGRLGSDAQASYAVTGDAVNTAARLQSTARPGETLVSRSTYLLAQHAFAFAPAGDVALKGKAEPLSVYRLLGHADEPRSARGLESLGLSCPLVGRQAELAQLSAALEGALAGHAQVVGLSGEAGAGKSRLVAEFLSRLQPGGSGGATAITVRRAACSPLGEPPYGVIAKFFRDAYGVSPGDTLEVARQKIEAGLRALGAGDEEALGVAPMLGYVLGLAPTDPVHGIEPERLSRQILAMLRIVLERRLAQGPLLLVVEDLHWADTASVEGLRQLADWLADRPLMLLATCRPHCAGLAAARAAQRVVHLAPLSANDTGAILAAFFDTALPAPLQKEMVERSAGNPFYLEELARGLIVRGILAREQGGHWTCSQEAMQRDIPPTIEGLLLSRIDRLAPAARRYLQEAAVLGPAFDPAFLARIGSAAEDRPPLLEELCGAGLLEAHAGGSFRFTHALLHDVAYHNLLQSRRAALHGRAGDELERLHGAHPKRLEELEALGHHLSLSDDPPRGARYLVAAGDWARGVYANDDALRHYQRALSALQGCEGCESEILDLHERLGDLFGLTGRRREALEHYEIVRQAAAREARTRLSRKIGALHWDAGERERGLACFREGLALLDADSDPIERAQLYQEMGRLAFRSGDNAAAVDWAERALACAERSARGEAAVAVAQALNTLGVALARLNRNQEAVAHIERSVRIALEHGLLQAACRSYANLGVLYASLDPRHAIDTCLTGLETAKKIGDVGFQSRLYANLAVAYCALTDRCDAEGLRAAEAAIALDRRLGQLDHLAVPLIVLGQIHQCHGDPARALDYYREALALAEDIGEPQLLFPCYDGLATLYLDQGDAAEAERHLIKAAEVSERAGLDRDSLVVLPFLC
jgi:adenylate cyclase